MKGDRTAQNRNIVSVCRDPVRSDT